MINQSTVLMATPIAQLATEKGIDLNDKASDIIKGLNDTTSNIVSFTEENIATELPEYTELVPEHTNALEMSSDKVAATIRGAMEVISKQVKPLLVKVEEGIRRQLSSDTAVERIMSCVDIEMINIEPSFLNSPFYPSSPAATFEDIDSVRLADLLKGSYPQLTGIELLEMIAVDVDDLSQFFGNPTEVKQVYDGLFVSKDFYTIFNHNSISNGVARINDQDNFRFDAFRTLVIGTLMLNKFVSMDEPLSGVTNVSLNDYRTSLIVTRDLFRTMLFRFKQVWDTRAAAGLVILGNNVKPVSQPADNLGGHALLTGKLTVGYNNAVLTMFADSDQLSLSEYAVGFIFAKIRGYNVRDIITDKEIIVKAWNEYCNDINTATILNRSALSVREFSRVMDSAYADEKYTATIDAMVDDTPPQIRLLARMQNKIDLSQFFNNSQMLNDIIDGKNSLMNTALAAMLSDCFDCPIASEILQLNAMTPAASIEQQRKVLACSIDKVIIRRLLSL
jgi:hypothetical protein